MNFSWNESSQKSVISGIKIAPEHSLRDRQRLCFFFQRDVDFGTAPDRTPIREWLDNRATALLLTDEKRFVRDVVRQNGRVSGNDQLRIPGCGAIFKNFGNVADSTGIDRKSVV